VEPGLTTDEVLIATEGDAALGNDSVEFGEAVEVPVDDRLVDMDPECLGRLKLGRIGWQVDEADALGHGERCGVPPGAVEDEKNDPVGSRASFTGEEGQSIVGKTIHRIVF